MEININIFKEENEIWSITKTVLTSMLLGIIFTVVISLLLGFRYAIVVTPSMTPVLPVHTMVLVEPTKFEDVKIGEIINCDFASETLTHRVVRFSENGNPIVRGDVPGFEKEVTRDIYNGKVVYDNYLVGKLVVFIKENLILVVGALMVLLMWYAFS